MNIIEMAEQAGLAYKTPKGTYWIDAGYPDIHLERFAELVAAAEREQCAKHYLGIMRDAVEQAVAKERDACAKVADNIAKEMYRQGEGPTGYILFVEECAAAIRARRDMYTKPQNIDTSAEHVHESDKSI